MAKAGFRKGKDGKSAADLLAELGPTLKVDIGRKSLSPSGQVPDLPLKGIRALIDTGAGGDCIDEELAADLRLPITEWGRISGVGGVHEAPVFTARMWVPQLQRLLFQRFTGVRLNAGQQWHGVILGRGFLRQYRLTYDGQTGEVDID